MGGDFNEVLNADEKLGGNPINNNRVKLFWSCLQKYGLVDLDFKHQKYTWTNKKHRKRCQLIFERLDRCVANASWIKNFPNALIRHLPRTKSDHYPLLVNLNIRSCPNISKPFRMEPMWCNHPNFRNLV